MGKLLLLFFTICFSYLIAKDTLKIGVLSYGTVNWELQTIKENKLDEKYGFNLEIRKIASKNGVAVSFMGDEVDMIVNDFVWVNRQKSEGHSFYFFPYSKAVGAIYVADKNINSIVDLKNKKIGIAGGSVDKSWLLFQAYAKKELDINLKNYLKPVFASPPILNKKVEDGSLEGALNFWHYNTRLEDLGFKKLITLNEILPKLGIKDENIPFIGWVFKQSLVDEDKDIINKFLNASYEAKNLLKTQKNKWKNIQPLMKAENDNVKELLEKGYIEGIPTYFDTNTINEMDKLYKVLVEYGGKDLIGNANSLDKTIFWNYKIK